MDSLNWIFTAIGVWLALIAFLFEVFQYLNKRRSPKLVILKKSILIGTIPSVILYLLGINFWVKKGEELSRKKPNTIGFELDAKNSKMEDNLSIDHDQGFKVKMESSDFRRNISKGTTSESTVDKTKDTFNLNNQPNPHRSKYEIFGSIVLNAEKGVVGNYDSTKMKYNMAATVANDPVRDSINIKIVDLHLNKTEIDSKTTFEKAVFYQSVSEKYAVFGEWEKAIDYAYKAFALYLEIPEGDSNPFIQNRRERESSAISVITKLNFYSVMVRKEAKDNYLNFLNRILSIAKNENNVYGIEILNNEIKMRSKQ